MVTQSYEHIENFIQSNRSTYKALLLKTCYGMNQNRITNYNKMESLWNSSDLFWKFIHPFEFANHV